ncbi:Integral membrane protein [Pseudomonas sp. IT-P171]
MSYPISSPAALAVIQPLYQHFLRRRNFINVDWLNFTPWSSLAGGALIELGASLFVVANRRIAGISGLDRFVAPGHWHFPFLPSLHLAGHQNL